MGLGIQGDRMLSSVTGYAVRQLITVFVSTEDISFSGYVLLPRRPKLARGYHEVSPQRGRNHLLIVTQFREASCAQTEHRLSRTVGHATSLVSFLHRSVSGWNTDTCTHVSVCRWRRYWLSSQINPEYETVHFNCDRSPKVPRQASLCVCPTSLFHFASQ
jgi:hypothetical protein